jgi:hypothetical protein
MRVSGLFSEGEAVAKLPRITCNARLHDSSHNENADYAALTVVWFQEEFAFPIQAEVLEQMKQIPFSKLAEKLDFFKQLNWFTKDMKVLRF